MMKMYLYLQFKRLLKVFPFVLLVAILLFAGLAAVFGGIMQLEDEDVDHQRLKVAITGDTDNPYISIGKAAMETVDSTRFALEMVLLDEEEAAAALQKGEIVAYAVFPEGFMEAALYGEIRTIKYITRPGMTSIVSILKEEITQVVVDLVEYTQKSVYGMADAIRDNQGTEIGKHVNDFSIENTELLLSRADVYTVEQIGVADGVSVTQYYICGIAVFCVLLLGIPYAALLVKKDYALSRMLDAHGHSSVKQVLCEYTAYAGVMLLLVACIIGGAAVACACMEWTDAASVVSIGFQLIPVVLMVAALNMLIFEASGNLVVGALLQFFISIALCFVCGCFYPIYALPQVLQSVSAFLPVGLARGYLANCIVGDSPWVNLGGVVLYLLLFISAVVLVRYDRVSGKRGER